MIDYMSDRIFYGKNPPFSLVETLNFSETAPYIIRQKKLENDDLAIMHYSNSLELSVYCNVEGHVTVDQSSWDFKGNSVLFIPPNYIHSVFLKKGEGTVYLIHISFDYLKRYVDIERMLKENNTMLYDFTKKNIGFEKMLTHIKNLIEYDNNIFRRTAELLLMFDDLTTAEKHSRKIPLSTSAQSSSLLHSLIEWTENNYKNYLVSVEDAASAIGLSKNYFCTWFKKLTGMTYNNYLNDVRIAKACSSLIRTGSVTKSFGECGFSTMSYFIQVFKKRVGMTPAKYIEATPM